MFIQPYFSTLKSVALTSLVLLPPHNFARQPYCYL